MSKVRNPAASGRFYEGSEPGLRSQIEECFTHPQGPGKIPETGKGPRKILGLVSPHAGYPYSGPVAAHGFSAVAKDGAPKTVIILGPNHSGRGVGVAIDDSDAWTTPLGEVELNEDIVSSIAEGSEFAEINSSAHASEHSLEVQIPFLQYFFDSDFQIVPICMRNQSLEASEDLGNVIGEVVTEENALILASTDLTHYETQDTAEERDGEVIKKMKGLDWKELSSLIVSKNYSVCGYGPVSATMLAAKSFRAEETELFKYATSGDTAGPTTRVVGYCSLGIFR
ncbi:hypothetical protein AKJ64_01675 [candidate division MSBL1 archaeon SCGC-AAA259E17]|uniref:MEMO1 family protein AKJ64_01675 n=1 Tax=candidate division MSBL1 archaeon SCGC-AAA259E17 TaxID=1698263 RepID=A0A133UFK5_9EURY|nr:hypothetical protein AKJ64_01675 [candidate division MSBL1 archaeon SCGC-AAA259E17]